MPEIPADNRQMASADHQQGLESFRVGFCSTCDRRVLTAQNVAKGQLVDCCLHCDDRLPSEAIDWVPPREVAALGYIIDGYDDEACDSHGGCRGEICGVRQPGQ